MWHQVRFNNINKWDYLGVKKLLGRLNGLQSTVSNASLWLRSLSRAELKSKGITWYGSTVARSTYSIFHSQLSTHTFKGILRLPDSHTEDVTTLCLDICTTNHFYWPELLPSEKSDLYYKTACKTSFWKVIYPEKVYFDPIKIYLIFIGLPKYLSNLPEAPPFSCLVLYTRHVSVLNTSDRG